MGQMGQRTWQLQGRAKVVASAAIGGPKEKECVFSADFDQLHEDPYLGQSSWEKAERRLLEEAIAETLRKGKIEPQKINLLFAGDLLNQIISSTFAAQTTGVPYFGLFNACATTGEALALAALAIEAGVASYTLAGAVSHNASAERQMRFPTEFGSQRPKTAQWTVTAAGSGLLSATGEGPSVTWVTVGHVVDSAMTDPYNMGMAEVPAAVDTLVTHFKESGRKPSDYDLIVTGDLAAYGLKAAQQLLRDAHLDMGERLIDAGATYYGSDPSVQAGASGAGCIASFLFGPLLTRMRRHELNRLLVVATGSLHSPVSIEQGDPIPCIAHAVALENN